MAARAGTPALGAGFWPEKVLRIIFGVGGVQAAEGVHFPALRAASAGARPILSCEVGAMSPLLRLALSTGGAWFGALLLMFVLLMVVAGLLGRASASTAEMAVLALFACYLLIAVGAVVWVYRRAGSALRPGMRWAWTAVFAVVQLGTCALAVLMTLVALNR